MNFSIYDDRWCAVQVTPRHEVIVSSILRSKGYEEFLPTYKVKRQWSDRRKEIEMPLFVGYVFCKLNSRILWSIVTTPGVIRIVGTRKEIGIIDEGEIQAIQAVVKYGIKVEPHAHVTIGDRVRITSGPLTGVEGLVTAYKNQQRLVLSVNMIQSSVSVEIDGCDMVPVGKAQAPSSWNHSSISHCGVQGLANPALMAG